MRTIQRTLLASAMALGLAASGSAFAQFTNTIFFGDSVSDSGNYKSILPPGTGKFTTNPGLVWTELFAQRFGSAAVPSTQGGTNYAYGGARVTSLPGIVDPPLSPAAAVPIATQIQQYLAKGPADPNAIYSIQGGGNDFFYQFALLLAGAATPAQVQAALGAAAIDYAKQAAVLKAAGARYIIVWSAPDMGTILSGAATGQGPTLTALSSAFNTTVNATLDALGIQAIRLNGFAWQNELLKNPAAYGLRNVTGIACTTPSTVTIAICSPSTLVAPDAPSTYFFANGAHPTTAGHRILADYAISVVTAPQQMAVLAEAPLSVEQANWRTLDSRMISGINAPRSTGKLQAWAAYDYGSPDFKGGFFSGDGNVHTVAVGGDMKITDRLLAGAQFGYSENRGDLGSASYKLTEPMGTVYVGYGDGPWYVGATVGAGGLDISTERNVALGALTRPERGDTRGSQLVARVMGGYWFQAGGWTHGPAVRVTYQDVKVFEFDEAGTNSTSMGFGEQRRKSLITSAGWQASGEVVGFRPYGRVTWEYENKSDLRFVTASVLGTGGSFSLPAYQPDSNYALVNLGVSREFGNVTGFVTGSGTAGKGDGNYYGVTVGVRMPL